MEAIQELSERKTKILHAIIKNYLETGEPVGSRTISKYTDLNLSSATIRNEMADLEELGYIMQPHTSAGRIPSDKGYRWYVDMLIIPVFTEKHIIVKMCKLWCKFAKCISSCCLYYFSHIMYPSIALLFIKILPNH